MVNLHSCMVAVVLLMLQSVLVVGKPHLGTERLVRILKAFREHLLALGVQIRFGAAIDDILVQHGRAVGVRLRGAWPACSHDLRLQSLTTCSCGSVGLGGGITTSSCITAVLVLSSTALHGINCRIIAPPCAECIMRCTTMCCRWQ